MKQFQWKAQTDIISGGFPGEEIGSNGGRDWQTTDVLSGSHQSEYYFTDSDFVDNNRSSRVTFSITDSWEVSFDNRNYMYVKIRTTINSITRTVRGNPGSMPRHIWVKREENGPTYFDRLTAVNVNEQISGAFSLPEITFTLAPGQGAHRSSLWVRSTTGGYESVPLPNIYSDVLAMGVSFKNILPPDYRPGDRKVNGVWQSHNRERGKADRIGYGEMRTQDGGVGTDNPPSRKANGIWYNQRKIGDGA